MKNYAIKLTKINRILDQENVTWIFATNLVNVVRRTQEPFYDLYNKNILEYADIAVT